MRKSVVGSRLSAGLSRVYAEPEEPTGPTVAIAGGDCKGATADYRLPTTDYRFVTIESHCTMPFAPPEVVPAGGDAAGLDAAVAALPDAPAVFLVRLREGAPYLARTGVLKRRLRRLVGERARTSRILSLRGLVDRIEYWRTASRLESLLIFYEAAVEHFPERYLELLKLRIPPFLKLTLTNLFPRTQVTTRIGSSASFYYGPFRTRAAAEQFEAEVLGLFQIRRCQEDLVPSPDHPGCIYGEMNMCLRPCQQAVGTEEYRSEVQRVIDFLDSEGRSLLDPLASARDRLSEEMNFEEAARVHARIAAIDRVLKTSDDLAANIDRLCGVAITVSTAPGAAELWFLVRGCWQPPVRFGFEIADGRTVSIDYRLHEVVAALGATPAPARVRQEHLALLARWYYSSWRDGIWLQFASLEDAPYRRMVRAISKVVAGQGSLP